jgi:hypothetical protein
MMRPDELREKMNAVDALREAVSRLQKAEVICSGQLYYNGHQGTKFTDDEATIVRRALVEHHREDVAIKANFLCRSGVDPTSLLPPMVTK